MVNVNNFFIEKLNVIKAMLVDARTHLHKKDEKTCDIQLLKIIEHLEDTKDAMRITTILK